MEEKKPPVDFRRLFYSLVIGAAVAMGGSFITDNWLIKIPMIILIAVVCYFTMGSTR